MSNADIIILKTKYSRNRNGKPECFAGYELCLGDKDKLFFPKGTTLAKIKKAYPEYADAKVAVMPSHTLKGLNTTKCEEIATVMLQTGFVTKPADVIVETASEEEQAEDLITEPTNTIYTLESERPNPIIMGFKAAEQIARSIPAGHYRRATVQGVVVNYYGYKERNGRMWVVGDTPDDLPSADVKIELSGEWLPAYEIF